MAKKKTGNGYGWAATIFIAVIGFMTVVGFGGLGNLGAATPPPAAAPADTASTTAPVASASSSAQSSLDIALACLSPDTPVAQQIHPQLSIIISGVEQPIPQDIGAGFCTRPISTTANNASGTASGTIDIQAPAGVEFTLGDFFAVWSQSYGSNPNITFSNDQILQYKADASHSITMTVDGQPSTAYENLALKDGQKIVISYGRK